MTQSRAAMRQNQTIKAVGGSKKSSISVGTKVIMDPSGLDVLIQALSKVGYQPIGPKVKDGAIVYEPITSANDLPVGLSDDQEGGYYRIVEGSKGSFFEYLVGPYGWKRYLFPQKQKLWGAKKSAKGLDIVPPDQDYPSYAFIGVRSCELQAILIQDKVFGYRREEQREKGIYSDPGYVARRQNSLIIAVNCARAGKTCFCASMGGDPHVHTNQGFDLALTELDAGTASHRFLVEVGSERGGLILEVLPYKEAGRSDIDGAFQQGKEARQQMGRRMVPDVNALMKRNLKHERWADVGKRCLSCANCTMVCPTCFCTTVEDTTDLKGDNSERWRSWDSCFTMHFSYIHGGAVRRETGSRYRQWITHKLSSWYDQFGSSGCVGCGRCIAWCPVGIDITEEARAISETDGAVSAKAE